jgi:hypothetical protein
MRVIALIEKPDIIEPILKYLDRWRISYRPVYRANVRYTGSTAACQQFVNRSMWATASGRLPVVQFEISESAHLEWLLSPAAVVQTPRKTILRRTGVGRGCVKTNRFS